MTIIGIFNMLLSSSYDHNFVGCIADLSIAREDVKFTDVEIENRQQFRIKALRAVRLGCQGNIFYIV